MAQMENYGEVDIYWVDERPEGVENATLLIGMQGEQGYAPFLTVMGCVGNAKPIAHICSKMQSIEAFNTVPEPLPPAWLLYQIESRDDEVVYVLRLTNWFPLVAQPDANPHAWLYSYTPTRDTLRGLVGLGITQLVFLATNNLARFIDPTEIDILSVIPPGQMVCYDFITDNELDCGDLVLTTPVWLFPYLFRLMVGADDSYLSCVACAGITDEYIDEPAVSVLSDYCNDVLQIDLSEKKMDEMRNLLNEMEDEMPLDGIEALKLLENNGLVSLNKNGDSVMWQ